MKQLFIWWHRRRAAHHNAIKHCSGNWNYHETWHLWHAEQLKIITSPSLACELCKWLDTLHITGKNIGEIRRSCFVPWDSKWNSYVREETANRESPFDSVPDPFEPQQQFPAPARPC
jgi:hypothetical protein